MKRDGIKGKKDSGLFLLYFLAYIIKVVYDIPPTDGHYHEGSYSSNDFLFFSILLKFCKGIIDLGLKQALVSNIKLWCESLWRRLDILYFLSLLVKVRIPARPTSQKSAAAVSRRFAAAAAEVSGSSQRQWAVAAAAVIEGSHLQQSAAAVGDSGIDRSQQL